MNKPTHFKEPYIVLFKLKSTINYLFRFVLGCFYNNPQQIEQSGVWAFAVRSPNFLHEGRKGQRIIKGSS